jgi:hypothetical protein
MVPSCRERPAAADVGRGAEAGFFGQSSVEVGDVSVVVLAVVDFHRRLVDVRLKGSVWVGQGGEGVAHGFGGRGLGGKSSGAEGGRGERSFADEVASMHAYRVSWMEFGV